MSRTGKIKNRPIEPEPLYDNKLLAKFINNIMKNGKKSTAQKLVYDALKRIETQKLDPLEIFQTA